MVALMKSAKPYLLYLVYDFLYIIFIRIISGVVRVYELALVGIYLKKKKKTV